MDSGSQTSDDSDSHFEACSFSTTESSSKAESDISSDGETEVDCEPKVNQEVTNPIIPATGLSSEYFGPLYDHADLTVFDSYLLLFQYSLRQSLTKKAFGELIQLVSVHLPCSSKSAESLYKLKGLFMKTYEDIKHIPYRYCCKCHHLMETTSCPSGCSASVEEFLHIPIQPQLKRKLEGQCT